jgi:hypothetical protein
VGWSRRASPFSASSRARWRERGEGTRDIRQIHRGEGGVQEEEAALVALESLCKAGVSCEAHLWRGGWPGSVAFWEEQGALLSAVRSLIRLVMGVRVCG